MKINKFDYKKSFFILVLIVHGTLFAENKAKEKTVKDTPVEKKQEDSCKDEKKKIREEFDKKLSIIQKKGMMEITKDLLAKEDALKDKEDELKKREEQISHLEMELAKRTAQLIEKQNQFIEFVDKSNKEKNERMNYLVQVISTMKPQQASEILSVQDAEVVVKILGKLEPLKASKIFNLMDKEISARIQKQYLDMKK